MQQAKDYLRTLQKKLGFELWHWWPPVKKPRWK
jgi:hypothetical protein